jgi:hypothetical protein
VQRGVQPLLEADHLGGKACDNLWVGRGEREAAAGRLERRETVGAVVANHLLEQVDHALQNKRIERPERIELAQSLLVDGQLAVLTAQEHRALGRQEQQKPFLAQRVVAPQRHVEFACHTLGRQRAAGEDTYLLRDRGQCAVALGLLAPVRRFLKAREEQRGDAPGEDEVLQGMRQVHQCRLAAAQRLEERAKLIT